MSKHLPEYAEQSQTSTLDFKYTKYHSDEKYRQEKNKIGTRLLLKKKTSIRTSTSCILNSNNIHEKCKLHVLVFLYMLL